MGMTLYGDHMIADGSHASKLLAEKKFQELDRHLKALDAAESTRSGVEYPPTAAAIARAKEWLKNRVKT